MGFRENFREGMQRRRKENLPCDAKGCFQVRRTVSPWCAYHGLQVRMYGHPTARPPSQAYRNRMIKAVHEALLDLDLPEEVINYTNSLSHRLQAWGQKLQPLWQSEAAGRMGAVDPLLLLAACVAHRLYEDECRDTIQLRQERPGWLAGKRLLRFESKQWTVRTRDVSNTRGCVNQASQMRGWNRVCDLLLSYRAPTRLAYVAHRLGKIVGPRTREELAAARREARAKSDAQSERKRQAAAPDEDAGTGRSLLPMPPKSPTTRVSMGPCM